MLSALGRLVAPDIPPVQDLKHHWNCFLEYYSTRALAQLKAEPVEKTNLSFHLNKILALLIAEQGPSGGELSPCLEFILHQDVLNILVTLCQADTPPGIRPYIFRVFIFLVEQVTYPLLPETACHLPLCRLTLVCSLTKASPTESQEIQFLSTLCKKISLTPALIQVFLPEEDSSSSGGAQSFSSRRSSRSSRRSSLAINLEQIETLALNVKKALETIKSRHYLMTALVNYLDSADYLLACSAMQNILTISQLDNDISATGIITGSPFLQTIVDRLVALFDFVPDNIPPENMEELSVNWAHAHKLHDKALELEHFTGRPELITFLSFLDYVDQLVSSSHSRISDSLALHVRTEFFDINLKSRILAAHTEEQIISGLSVLSMIWSHVSCRGLQEAYTRWFLSSPAADPHLSEETSPLVTKVLALWEAQQKEVSIESMRLFEVFLTSPSEYFLDSLVTSHLEGRGYYHYAPAESDAASWSDVEDERERTRTISPDIQMERKIGQKYPSRTLAPSNIHRVVNLWLYLVSDELRLDELRGTGYDMYVKDASRQIESVCEVCREFSSWPPEATQPRPRSETSSLDSRSESDPSRNFYEGDFVSGVLDHLEKALDTEYDTNLQTTSILSKLCQLPHPYLHEFLMNPTIPLAPGVRSLYTTLKSVLTRGTERAASVEHFPKKMQITRRKLLGDSSDGGTGHGDSVEVTGQEQMLLEAIVVIDEFCKELAAIALVKYHMFSQ